MLSKAVKKKTSSALLMVLLLSLILAAGCNKSEDSTNISLKGWLYIMIT
ncbi:MAG: hypothetical protein GX206_11900 [Clostridiales bacterium]|nr:hypothetical protein [Clostridiales bacterium]